MCRSSRRGGGRVVDIRQHLTTEKYTGYTKRGLRLSGEEWDALIEQAPKISKALGGDSDARGKTRVRQPGRGRAGKEGARAAPDRELGPMLVRMAEGLAEIRTACEVGVEGANYKDPAEDRQDQNEDLEASRARR